MYYDLSFDMVILWNWGLFHFGGKKSKYFKEKTVFKGRETALHHLKLNPKILV